ncbi:coiled-coil domain-containing protein 115-like [Chrysoperla carnea]|uniref:coiled-coil domain-containing protein 115-like n=1 Tax=Chrysoperla carnea TaxID=189513 RepID=UPI001D088BB0|nr:coiled-coil domain-containing protein 115-like [Chrysoperla carnea]
MSLEEINNTIDNLALDYLTLLEQNIQENVSLEQSIKDGNYHLVKARYIMGHRNVSSLQLPNEDSPDFKAMVKITENEVENSLDDKFDLEIKNNTTNNGGEGDNEDVDIVNPVKWFGVLVPQDLKHAQSKFQHASHHVKNCANIQSKIDDISDKLLFLLNVKDSVNTEA